MLSLINILILFFIILISYQLLLGNIIVEGLDNNTTYQAYNMSDPLILAQQNAGNIEYIKQRLDSIQNMYQQVQDLSGNFQSLQDQVNSLVLAQNEYATQITGGTAPEITGLDI